MASSWPSSSHQKSITHTVDVRKSEFLKQCASSFPLMLLLLALAPCTPALPPVATLAEDGALAPSVKRPISKHPESGERTARAGRHGSRRGGRILCRYYRMTDREAVGHHNDRDSFLSSAGPCSRKAFGHHRSFTATLSPLQKNFRAACQSRQKEGGR